jgi:hypothetical protein
MEYGGEQGAISIFGYSKMCPAFPAISTAILVAQSKVRGILQSGIEKGKNIHGFHSI